MATPFSVTVQEFGSGKFVLSGDINAVATLHGSGYYSLTGDIVGTLTMFSAGYAHLIGNISGLFSGTMDAIITFFGVGKATIAGTIGSSTLNATVSIFGTGQASIVGSVSGGTPPPPTPTPGVAFITDNFNAPDGTNLDGRVTTTGYRTWKQIGPNAFTIEGNILTETGDGGVHEGIGILNVGLTTNFAVQTDVVAPVSGNSDSGISVLQKADGTGGWAFTLGGPDLPTTAYFYPIDNGSIPGYPLRYTDPLPSGPSRIEVIDIDGSSNKIRCFKGDTLIFEVSSTSYSAGNLYAGVYDDFSAVVGTWDNFQAEFLPSYTGPVLTGISPASGSNINATSVTISGYNFATGATAKIGTTSLTGVTVVNATTITATVPGGMTLGTYDLSVTNPDTQVGTLSSAFAVLPLLSNPQFAVQNTTVTNSMGSDGYSWSQANPILVDPFNKIIALAEDVSGNHSFVFSNDGGATWAQSSISQGFLLRGMVAYDSANDKLHVLWSAVDPADGVIYRRYSISRDGSNNITDITRPETGINLQLDFQSTGSMSYAHPLLFWLNDAAYGANGALVAMWSAANSASPTGSEIRASMRVLSNSNADNTAGNWLPLATSSSTTIGNAPTVTYTALATTSHTGGLWLSALRKSNKDFYLFWADPTGTGDWNWRRLPWNAGSNNWDNTFTSVALISHTQRAGTDTGYGSKHQLGTKPVEDTTTSRVYFGFANWKDNTSGDTFSYVYVDSGGALSSIVDVYSANGTHSYAPTGDIIFDATSGVLVTAYLKTSGGGTYARPYSGTAPAASETLIFNTSQIDIPLLWQGARYGTGSPKKLLVLFRNTSSPRVGYFGTLDWS